eukprot:s6677_g2.t2
MQPLALHMARTGGEAPSEKRQPLCSRSVRLYVAQADTASIFDSCRCALQDSILLTDVALSSQKLFFASARVLCTEGLCHTSVKSVQLQTSRDHTAARFCSFTVRRFSVMAVGSPLLQPNAEDKWKVLSKCKQLWQRCLPLSEPKVVAQGTGPWNYAGRCDLPTVFATSCHHSQHR